MNRRNWLAGLVASVPVLQTANAQDKPLLVLHRVAAAATVHAPMQSVDLEAWAFQLTSEEYVRCAPDEHNGSVQARLPDGRRVFVSVETIGGNFMSHQYVAEVGARDYLRAVSPTSQIWSRGSQPTSMRVTWELKLEAIGPAVCRLNCKVTVETNDAEMLAWVAHRPADARNPVQTHCEVETPLFAADIERKALRGVYAVRS
jgi:hypothetical protein